MIITEESVNFSQLDELSERLFKVKGKINLDRNDLVVMLGGNFDSKLITFQREEEESKEFLTKLTSYLSSKPEIKRMKGIMMYFGYSTKHPLRMEDMALINEFLAQAEGEFDAIWGIHENPDEIGLSAEVIINTER